MTRPVSATWTTSSCSSRTATACAGQARLPRPGSSRGMYHLQTARLFVVDNAYLPIHVAPHRPDDDGRPGLARGGCAQAVRAGHARRRSRNRSGPSSTATTTRSWSGGEWTRAAVCGRPPDAGRAGPRARLAADRLLLRRRPRWPPRASGVLAAHPALRRSAGRPLRADVPRSRHRQAGGAGTRCGPAPGGAAGRRTRSCSRPTRTSIRRRPPTDGYDVVVDPTGPRSTTCSPPTDILITDYSSSVIEFALLRRPIVLLVADLAEYERDPGLYLDYRTEMIGTQVVDTDGVIDAIRPTGSTWPATTPSSSGSSGRRGAARASGSWTASSATGSGRHRARWYPSARCPPRVRSRLPFAMPPATGGRSALVREGIARHPVAAPAGPLPRPGGHPQARRGHAPRQHLVGPRPAPPDGRLRRLPVDHRHAKAHAGLPAVHLLGDPALEVVHRLDHRRDDVDRPPGRS